MEILNFVTGPLENNVYLVYNEISKDCFLVDAAKNSFEVIMNRIDDLELNLKAVLLTHGHFDHIADVKKFQNRGAKIYLHEKDIDLVNEPGPMAKMCGVEVEKFFPDIVISNECTLKIIGYNIKVLYTPGHTQGGVIYILDNIMFSGDTIFRGSIGRFDFPESDYNDIIKSVKRVLSMEGDYIILPGHGSSTTLDLERKINVVNE